MGARARKKEEERREDGDDGAPERTRTTDGAKTRTARTHERMTISLTVQPRIQREKWSLYWKESMMTKTDILDPVVMSVDEKTTKVGDVLQMLSTRMEWPPKHELLRLEGFEEAWETCVLNGKE